jgi:Zn-finger nucleic acid-binding protein
MQCLRCRDQQLVEGSGVLQEAVCPGCRGRLLDGDATTRLLQDHCGLDRALVGELCAHFKGRTPCPACGRGMSLVPVVGVAVDLCGSCGSLFLDAGELTRLSRGALVEVGAAAPEDPFGPPPSPPSPPPSSSSPPAAASRPAGRDAAVFLVAPLDDAQLPLVQEVWQAVGFRTAVDARGFWPRARGGVFADDCSAVEARQLVDALAGRGVAAAAVDDAAVAQPASYRLKELGVAPDHLVVADALGRSRTVPTHAITALCAGRSRVVVTADAPHRGRAGETAKTVAAVVAPRVVHQLAEQQALASRSSLTTMVEREQLVLDIVVAGERFRLDDEGFVARADGPRDLAALAARLDAVAPASAARQRGFLALLAGAAPPMFRSLREYDREVARALWRRGDGASRKGWKID